MGVRENSVEQYLDEEVSFFKGISRKWVSPGCDGVPDRIIIRQSKVYFVEVKTIDGALKPHQVREHSRLMSYGACVSTVYGHDGVDQWIRKVLLK